MTVLGMCLIYNILSAVGGTTLRNTSVNDIEVKDGVYGCASVNGVTGMPSSADGIMVVQCVPGLFATRQFYPMNTTAHTYRSARALYGEYSWSAWVEI